MFRKATENSDNKVQIAMQMYEMVRKFWETPSHTVQHVYQLAVTWQTELLQTNFQLATRHSKSCPMNNFCNTTLYRYLCCSS